MAQGAEADLDRLAQEEGARLYLRPILGPGPSGFTTLEVILRSADRARTARAVLAVAELRAWARTQPAAIATRAEALLANIAAAPPPFAGLSLDRPRLMGIVNVTPDSFSDGGAWLEPERAVEHARALVAAGADIIDLGAESTRPGATPVPPEEEIHRLDPVLRALVADGVSAVISIDTRHAATMRHGVALGARIINDVSALTDDPESLPVVVGSQSSVVLMHKQGQPVTMNLAPVYADVVLDVFDYLEERIAACERAGIARSRILVDPGIAFGKKPAHSMALLASLAIFTGLGTGILVGVSRKGILGERDGSLPPRDRLPGSLAAALWAWTQGAQVFRVHDVAESALAFSVWRAAAARWRDGAT